MTKSSIKAYGYLRTSCNWLTSESLKAVVVWFIDFAMFKRVGFITDINCVPSLGKMHKVPGE